MRAPIVALVGGMRRAVVVSFVLLLVSASAMASPLPSYDLVDPRVCLAGEWGRSTRYEWRIQLGLFNHERVADRRARVVARRGLATESYIAAWLARGDREPIVVVSRSFKSRRAALRAIRRYRAAVPRAFARRYQRWVQSEARRGFEHGGRHASLLPELCGCAVLGGVRMSRYISGTGGAYEDACSRASDSLIVGPPPASTS